MNGYDKKTIIGQYAKSRTPGETEIQYLRAEDGLLIEFPSHSAAENWLIQSCYNLNDYLIRTSIGRCYRCRNALYPSDIEEYTSQCFHCDEDFYDMEQITEEVA